ncbi:MAG: hypothetical protein M0Z72_03845 [Deltaproteobacteria bacterium]|nr:hypothetical protein [Deltaproteobacteria bacterium]
MPIQSEITDSVNKSVEEICNYFQDNPSFFFTENDIVCYFYSILKQNLREFKFPDKDNKLHSIIHMEYPTPFRCDMKDYEFKPKSDDDRTKNGGKYKRGHYDVVVLNPEFISQYSYDIIKAQNYESFKKEEVLNKLLFKPVIYGIEIIFKRDKIKFPDNKDNKGIEKTFGIFLKQINQDFEKLQHSRIETKFMDNIKMLVFIRESSHEVKKYINQRLSNYINKQEIKICFAK